MSAYVVNQYHINCILNYARREKIYHYWNGEPTGCSSNPWDGENLQRMGQLLYDANVFSVNGRYDEHSTPQIFRYTEDFNVDIYMSDVQALKACHCLEYQSCEFLRRICDHIERKFPNYESAQWEIKEHSIGLRKAS